MLIAIPVRPSELPRGKPLGYGYTPSRSAFVSSRPPLTLLESPPPEDKLSESSRIYSEAARVYDRLGRLPVDLSMRLSRVSGIEHFATAENDLLGCRPDRTSARWHYFGGGIVSHLSAISPKVRSNLAVLTRDHCLIEMLHAVNFATDISKYVHHLARAVGQASLISLLSATYTLRLYAENPSPRHKMSIWGSLGHTCTVSSSRWLNARTDPELSGNPSIRAECAELLRSLSIHSLMALSNATVAYEFTLVPKSDQLTVADSELNVPDQFRRICKINPREKSKKTAHAFDGLKRVTDPASIAFDELFLALDIIARAHLNAPKRFSCFSGLASYALGIGPNEKMELERALDVAAIKEGVHAFQQHQPDLPETGSIVTPLLFRRGLELQYSPQLLVIVASPYQSITSHPVNLLPFEAEVRPGKKVAPPFANLGWAIGLVAHAIRDQVERELGFRKVSPSGSSRTLGHSA